MKYFQRYLKQKQFFSLEMSEKQVMDRLTSIHIQTNAQELQQPHLIPEVKWNRLGGALEKIGKADFYLYSDSNSSADYIVNLIKKTIVKEKISIVVIDYLQLLEGSKNRSEQNRVYELSAITRALKNISRNFGVTVILLSQLSRDIEKRTDPTPRLSDLRDSGSIEQDSDIVVFLHKKPEVESFGKEQVKEVIVTVAKHRSGPLGTFNLGFIPEYTRFENLAN
jgi:replicative DNA helicase